MPENDFTACIVCVQGISVGTGFFFRRNGRILTCFHLIGDLETGEVRTESVKVFYKGNEYAVTIENSNQEQDIAILRLNPPRMPKGATTGELAVWDKQKHGDVFRTFGYRPTGDYDGVFADGQILGLIHTSEGLQVLQIASQAVGEESLRPGMSGAPVYIAATNQIVGMIRSRVVYTRGSRETVPVAVSMANAMKEVPLLEHVGFVNREDERKKARGTAEYAPRCIIFDAPARYGKTDLLCAIEDDHIDDGWHCIMVETRRDTASAIDLVQQIVAAAEVQIPFQTTNVETAYHTLATVLQNQINAARDQGEERRGVALFIDNIEHLPQEEIFPFLHDFLSPMLATLGAMRVRMAGCYVGSGWEYEANRTDVLLKVLPLSPFRFEYVRDTVRIYRPEQESKELFAAHIMHVTGGHPGCMRTIINEDSPEVAIEEQFAHDKQQEYYHRIVKPIADEVRQTIPEHVRNAFDTLCVFRQYDSDMLKRITAAGYLDSPLHNLIRSLTATYFIKLNSDNGFYSDNIVRRLLVLRLYWEDPERFKELCNLARRIYYETQYRSVSHAALITIEYLYQELQLAYYTSDYSAEARGILQTNFFAEDGVLRQHLQPLFKRDDAWEFHSLLMQRLREAESDWEFQFMINFLLRDNDYTDTPYQQLLQTIEASFNQQ